MSSPGLTGWLGPSLKGDVGPPPGAGHAGALTGAPTKRPEDAGEIKSIHLYADAHRLEHLLTVAERVCH